MSRKLKRKASSTAPGTRSTPTPEARDLALLPRAAVPIAPLEKVQQQALALRAEHPDLDDDTLALVILHVQTGATIAAIAKKLGADRSWAYARFARPEVQAFTAQLALASLGVAAARGIATVTKLLDSRDETTRFNAAVELMDRAGVGNTTAQRRAGNEGTGYAFTFGGKPKDVAG